MQFESANKGHVTMQYLGHSDRTNDLIGVGWPGHAMDPPFERTKQSRRTNKTT